MKITFLGAGAAVPAPKIKGKTHRSYSAILIEINKDKLLFDIGPGTLTKLQQIGIDTRIYPTHLFITHYHIDHFHDLFELINEKYLIYYLHLFNIKKPINIYGPPGLNKLVEALLRIENIDGQSTIQKHLLKLPTIKIKEIEERLVEKSRYWQVTAIPIKHRDGLAFRLDTDKKSLVYSGDMEYDENIIKFANKADLVILECNSPDKKNSIGSHLCPEKIARLSKLGNLTNIILTHLSPLCEDKEQQIIKYIENRCRAKIQIAYDFFQVDL